MIVFAPLVGHILKAGLVLMGKPARISSTRSGWFSFLVVVVVFFFCYLLLLLLLRSMLCRCRTLPFVVVACPLVAVILYCAVPCRHWY